MKTNIYLYSADNNESYEDFSEISFVVAAANDEEALAAGKQELERREIANYYFNEPRVFLTYRDVTLNDPVNYEVLNHIAQIIACESHAGQFRRDGKTPYYKHVEAVADQLPGYLKAAGYLHDVAEDTKTTFDDLRNAGIPEHIIGIVDLLTHRAEDSNETYWNRIATNPDAVQVKLADINSNLSDKPTDKQKTKYKKALTLFARKTPAAQEMLDKFFP
jgi:hypothetical protein